MALRFHWFLPTNGDGRDIDQIEEYASLGISELIRAVEVHLRPVLVELGASVPSRGLYVTEPELADRDKAIARWSDAALPLITTAVRA
jgi:FMN reductase